MRRLLPPVLVLAAALLAAGAAAAGTKPLVPVYVQHLIAQRAPQLAYVPARGAIPYRYRSFRTGGGALRIWFVNRNEPRKLVVFDVRAFHGSCRAGAQKSFQMAGVKVWFDETPSRQTAWRCVHGRKVSTWTTLGSRTFSGFGLARIAASGHRI